MVLNIFPRRETKAAPAPEAEPPLPEPTADVIEAAEERKHSSRRGSRGGRGRSRSAGEVIAEEADQLQPPPDEASAAPARRGGRSRTTAKAAEAPDVAVQPEALDGAKDAAPARPARKRASKDEAATTPATADGSTAAIMRAIEAQGRQIEQLARLQEEIARRPNGHGVAAPPARVGVFVDSANVELASDRLRARFDWGKILHLLTKDRQLVRAIAYSPVHDDPGVSIETQRFVEPFLDRGYKVVTKPLKRFADGSIKANVDIELALDVIEMLDRLDVVVLISGDGDFQRLVEVVQSKGVRVEVAAVGSSTASNLRHAADHFIDLQSRLKEVRA